MNPTQEQIAEAQQAGNVAYSEARANGAHPTECYDVYRAAYDAKRDEQEQAMRDWNDIKGDCAL